MTSFFAFSEILLNYCSKLVGIPCTSFHSKTCLLRLRQSSRSGGSGTQNSGSNKWKNKAYLNDVSLSLIKTDFLLYKHFFDTNKKVKSEIMNCNVLGRAVKAIFITPSSLRFKASSINTPFSFHCFHRELFQHALPTTVRHHTMQAFINLLSDM